MPSLAVGFCLVLTFYTALLASLIVTPWIRSCAHRFDFVDRPDGRRKTHGRAVAVGGGLAVLIAAVVAVIQTFYAASVIGQFWLSGHELHFVGLAGASLLIVLVGLVDDRVALGGWYKLTGQIAACAFLMFCGFVIERVALFSWTLELGILSIPFTLLWMLAAINAINLIDGIDGLASTVGVVLCLTLTVLTLMLGDTASAIVVLALAGALLGFLRYNFAPASIFLGDSGSMLIGLIIGAVAITSSLKSAATMTLAIPFAVCAIPLLDSAAAIVRRKLTGRSLFATDRGHFHHSLLVRGWSVRQTVLIIGAMCAVTCAGAVAGVYYQKPLIAILTVAGMVAFLVTTRTFGHIEFALVSDRVRSTTGVLSSRSDDRHKGEHQSYIQLQGSEAWDQLWTSITESAEDKGLCRIELTLHLPALQEALYATWRTGDRKRSTCDGWRIASPLTDDGETIGKIVVIGADAEGSAFAHIAQIADFLEPVEESIHQMVSEIAAKRQTASTESPEEGPDVRVENAGTQVESGEPAVQDVRDSQSIEGLGVRG